MKKLTILILAVAALASCQKGDDGDAPVTGQVTIDPIITRATEVNFEDEDKIGLTITKESDGEVFANNTLMTFGNGVFSGNLPWYTEANDASTLTAYYPYSSAGTPTEFTVATDQSTAYSSSDFMAAKKEGVLPSVNSVSMTFQHMLTKILVNVDNQTGNDITSIVLKGSIPTAKIHIAEMTVEVDDSQSPVDITAQQVTANQTYRAIVVPQSVKFTLAVTTSDGKTLTQGLASASLIKGGQYSIGVRVLPDNLQVSMSGDIENWTDEGAIGTEEDEVGFEEFANYFVYDGVTYPTVELSNGSKWMAAPLRYIPAGYTPSSDALTESHIWYPYSTDGTTATPLTDDASIAANGYLYDLYAALGGKEITPDNSYSFEGKQGICPPGWHIPTRAEYFDLVGSSTKDDFGESGTQIKNDALFFDTAYQSGTITNANAAGFNYVFAGVRMQNGFSATPSYQVLSTKDNTCSIAEWIGLPALSHYMTSTCYKPVYDTATGTQLTNIQFFTMQSTFSSSYKEGKLALAYTSILNGQQIRCVKDAQ